METISFEEALPIIDECLRIRAIKWKLFAVPSITYDDVCQIIRIHFFRKIHLFDPSKGYQLNHWINTVISHQLTNITKSIHSANVKPCGKCSCNDGPSSMPGVNLCSVWGQETVQCPFYKLWYDTKRHALNVRSPVTLEDHTQEVYERPNSDLDYESGLKIIHKLAKELLTDLEYEIYDLLYIQELDESAAAKKIEKSQRYINEIKVVFIKKIKDSYLND